MSNLVEKISLIYLSVLTIVSPFYISGITNNYSGIITNLFILPTEFWKIIFISGLCIVTLLLILYRVPVVVYIFLAFLTIGIVVNLYKHIIWSEYNSSLGFAWGILAVFGSVLSERSSFRVVFVSLSYLTLVNFFLSIFVKGALYFDADFILFQPNTMNVRSTGFFDTPLALGFFSFLNLCILTFFYKNDRYSFRQIPLMFILNICNLLLSESKGAFIICVFFLFSVLSYNITKRFSLSMKILVVIPFSLIAMVGIIFVFSKTFAGFSHIYKPIAILEFYSVLFSYPTALILGFTPIEIAEFQSSMSKLVGAGSMASIESWVNNGIASHGVSFLLSWFILFGSAFRKQFGYKQFVIGSTSIFILGLSMISNGGLGFPTGLLAFVWLGSIGFARSNHFPDRRVSLKK